MVDSSDMMKAYDVAIGSVLEATKSWRRQKDGKNGMYIIPPSLCRRMESVSDGRGSLQTAPVSFLEIYTATEMWQSCDFEMVVGGKCHSTGRRNITARNCCLSTF